MHTNKIRLTKCKLIYKQLSNSCVSSSFLESTDLWQVTIICIPRVRESRFGSPWGVMDLARWKALTYEEHGDRRARPDMMHHL